jgi:carbon monoxide dehydrogenase subunit G
MYKFEKSVFINRPQQEVFDFMTDLANDSKWQSGVELSEWTSDGPPAIGSTHKVIRNMLGRNMEVTMDVTSWDPPNQWGNKSNGGPVPFEGTQKFESKDRGTLVTFTAQAELGGFFKLAEGLVGKQLEKQMETDSAKLKKLLEAG